MAILFKKKIKSLKLNIIYSVVSTRHYKRESDTIMSKLRLRTSFQNVVSSSSLGTLFYDVFDRLSTFFSSFALYPAYRRAPQNIMLRSATTANNHDIHKLLMIPLVLVTDDISFLKRYYIRLIICTA